MKKIERPDKRNRNKIIIALIILFVNGLLQNCAETGIIVPEQIESVSASLTESQEEIVTIKPIIEYGNYFKQDDGKVFGLLDSSVKLIEFKDKDGKALPNPTRFISDDGIIFMEFITSENVPDETETEFEVVEVINCYSQKDGKVTEIAEIPEYPEPIQIEMKLEPFEIKNGMYNDIEISTVYNGTRATAFLPVTGSLVTDDGMWFNVSETFNAMTEAGLWFYGIEANNPVHKLENGRLW